MFGTNGLGLKVCLDQFKSLELEEETKARILRENAVEFFALED
jgi:predicted TIM-barrel fold metal-dependent hydrolase